MWQFHHVGIVTDQPREGEIYVAETKVHVTNPADHPDRIEYLRFEPDSPVTGPLRSLPHLAFKVPSLEPELKGRSVLLGPFQAMENLRVVFIQLGGAVIELMEFSGQSAFDGSPAP